jgi:PAS domain S-box-containing protein
MPVGTVGVVNDVSERHRAHEAIADLHAHWQAYFMNNPLPSYLWESVTGEFTLLERNSAAELSPLGDWLTVDSAASVAFRDYPNVFSGLQKCAKRRIVTVAELDNQALEATRYLRLTFVPLPLEQVLMHAANITRERAAQQLLLEAAADVPIPEDDLNAYFRLDAAGKISEGNAAAQHMLGPTSVELLHRPFVEVLGGTPLGRDRATRLLARIIAGEVVRDHEVTWQRNGETRWLRCTLRPLHGINSEFVGAMGLLYDVTDLQMEVRDLRERESALRAIFDRTLNPLLVVDPARDEIRDANAQACKLLGYTYGELVSKRPSDIHPEEMPRFLAIAQAAAQKGQIWTDSLSCTTKGGSRIPVDVDMSGIRVSGRNCVVVMIRTITTRRHADPGLALRLKRTG